MIGLLSLFPPPHRFYLSAVCSNSCHLFPTQRFIPLLVIHFPYLCALYPPPLLCSPLSPFLLSASARFHARCTLVSAARACTSIVYKYAEVYPHLMRRCQVRKTVNDGGHLWCNLS